MNRLVWVAWSDGEARKGEIMEGDLDQKELIVWFYGPSDEEFRFERWDGLWFENTSADPVEIMEVVS